MSTVTSKDGTHIAYYKTGSGPAVILVNGAMSYRGAFDLTLPQLAELLGKHFTVYDYARRGRDGSGDTQPFARECEIEDLQAIVGEAGGKAMVSAFSSGCAVALDTTAVTPGITKLAVYEAPFIVDDGRPAVARDYVTHLNKLTADGKLDEAVEYFLTEAVRIPSEYIGGIKQDTATWHKMTAIAHTIAYNGAFVADLMQGKPLPTGRWANVTVPVLVVDGGDSEAWMHNAADALGEILPGATRRTLEGQSHMFAPEILAPVLVEFFKS